MTVPIYLHFSANPNQNKKEANVIETKLYLKPTALSRQSRALRLNVDRVCSSADCLAGLKFSEGDVQRDLDEIVGKLLMHRDFGV